MSRGDELGVGLLEGLVEAIDDEIIVVDDLDLVGFEIVGELDKSGGDGVFDGILGEEIFRRAGAGDVVQVVSELHKGRWLK
jgi:hypothetical protein